VSILASLRQILSHAPAHPDGNPAWVTVCECNAWKDYVLQVMRPHATRVRLRPGQSAQTVLAAIPPATRLVAIQIDASVTTDFPTSEPEFLAELEARGITVLNANGTDIRKSALHARCIALGLPCVLADADGPPNERVIIKTTLNAGGAPERKLVRQWGAHASQFALQLSNFVLGPKGYVVCRRDAVPAAVWGDPTLVVERFIENPAKCFYKALVVGDAAVVTEAWSDREIKRVTEPIRGRNNYYYWTRDGEHVAVGRSSDTALRALSLARCLGQSRGLELQATDFVMDADGTLIPVDVNKTPFCGRRRRSPKLTHLQHGIDDLLASHHLAATTASAASTQSLAMRA